MVTRKDREKEKDGGATLTRTRGDTKESRGLDVKDVAPPSLASALSPLLLPSSTGHGAGLAPDGALGLVGVLLDPALGGSGDSLALVDLGSDVVSLRVSDTGGGLVGEELQ